MEKSGACQVGWLDTGVISTRNSPYAKLHPVPVRAATMLAGFWQPRIEANRRNGIPALLRLLEEHGVVDNFRRVSGRKKVERRGPYFTDSDLCKWMEGAAWVLHSTDEPWIKETLESTIDEVVAAQRDDGATCAGSETCDGATCDGGDTCDGSATCDGSVTCDGGETCGDCGGGNPCTPGYAYSYGYMLDADVTGARADIECRNVTLCNECASPPHSHSNAFVAVYAIPGDWAQCGWVKSNDIIGTYGEALRRRYAEVYVGGDRWVEYGSVDPGNGTVNAYKVVLHDLSTGDWYFYVDYTLWKHYAHAGWANRKGMSAQYVGEIWGLETDLPGTNGDRCSFSECRYDVNNQGTWPLTDLRMFSTDRNEWQYLRLSDCAFHIWDVNPHP